MKNNNNGGKNNTSTNIFGTGFSLRRFLLETAPSIIENGNRTRNFDIERGQFDNVKRDRTKYNGTYKNIGAIGGVNNGASCSSNNSSSSNNGPSTSKLKLNKKNSFDNSKEQLPQTTLISSTDPTTSSTKLNTQNKSLNSDSNMISSAGSSCESKQVALVLEGSSSAADYDSDNDVSTNNKWFIEKNFCPICFTIPVLPNEFKQLQLCKHEICHRCLERYVKSEILEFRTAIACPQCTESLHPSDIEMILNYDKKIISKYEEYMVRKYLLADPDSRWCPAPDCGYAVIASGCASCPRIRCQRPGCGLSFCYHCKAEWHPDQTCDQARAIRQQQLQQRQQQSKHRHNHQFIDITSHSSELQVQSNDIKPCPRCRVLIVKMDDGSCNHMVCSICNAEFCWLCMKEISDLHYLSPSGCTFWGKKPWSRKKKIMWQIGTLIGAPVGIALVAGIAVPAMIIGIPVWIGKKIYVKYFKETRLKRNLAVATSVLASFLVSPILASLVVAVGVPILLFYVYGVVPVALCRSGCDVTQTTSQDEIHYDFNATNTPKTDKSEPTKPTAKKITKKTVCSSNSTESIVATAGEVSLATGSTTKRKSKLNDLKNEEEEQQQKLLDNISENDTNIIICNESSVSRSIGDVSLSVGSVNNIVGGCNTSTTSSSSSAGDNHHRSSNKKYDQDSTTALAGSILNDNTSCTDSGNSSIPGYDTTRCNQMILDVCSIDSRTDMIPCCSNNSNNNKKIDNC